MEKIDLSNNKLVTIENRIYIQVKNLNFLSFRNNSMNNTNRFVFIGKDNQVKDLVLDFSFNRLKSIPDIDTRRLNLSFEKIDLEANLIEDVDKIVCFINSGEVNISGMSLINNNFNIELFSNFLQKLKPNFGINFDFLPKENFNCSEFDHSKISANIGVRECDKRPANNSRTRQERKS